MVVTCRAGVLATGEFLFLSFSSLPAGDLFSHSSDLQLLSRQDLAQESVSGWTSPWFRWAGTMLRSIVAGRARDCLQRRSGSGLHVAACKVEIIHTKFTRHTWNYLIHLFPIVASLLLNDTATLWSEMFLYQRKAWEMNSVQCVCSCVDVLTLGGSFFNWTHWDSSLNTDCSNYVVLPVFFSFIACVSLNFCVLHSRPDLPLGEQVPGQQKQSMAGQPSVGVASSFFN